MFGPGGHLYTYFVYGMHWCANIVTGPDGNASAVLLGPVRWSTAWTSPEAGGRRARADRLLARGPAGLATVLGLDGSDSGADLCLPDSTIRLHAGSPAPDGAIRTGPRVGVATAADLELRFWIADDPTVSALPGVDAAPPVGRSRRADQPGIDPSRPSGRGASIEPRAGVDEVLGGPPLPVPLRPDHGDQAAGL